jgi:hypothetical protein
VSVVSADRQVRVHEASHAAHLLLRDWPPAFVRVDQPNQRLIGSVRPDWTCRDIDADAMALLLGAVLQGPLADGVKLLEPWPIGEGWPAECQHDAETARFLASWLAVDRVAWAWIVYDAVELSRTRPFRTLMLTIADELEFSELLVRPELEAIREAVI